MACSKARQAFLGLVLRCLTTFVLISRVKGDTLCFACDKMFHPAGCGRLTRCGPHEVCYTVKGTSATSSDEEFTSGCMAREDCQGSLGSNLHPFHTELCSQCCDTDLCNAYLCEQKLPSSMICASCSDVSDVDTCLKVAFCHADEVCSSKHAPQSNTYTLGCVKKEACSGSTTCCNNPNLCNLNLTKTSSDPTQVSVTSYPSSSTSWPSATDSETIATSESSVGVDNETITTVTFFSSVNNNTTSEADSVSSPISTHGDLDTPLVTSTLGVTGSQDVTSEGRLSFSSTAGWFLTTSETSVETQLNNTIPSVIVGGESLCYSCEEMSNPVICSKFQVCGPHETCFTEKWLTSSGDDEFSSGCVAREDCHNTELDRGNVHRTVECSQCCYGDLCNDKLCKAEVLIPQTILLCAVCQNIPDLHTCLDFRECTAGVCAAEQTAGGFTLGCRKTEDCTGDVVCCNDTNLCNVKGGSNVHAPSSEKTTLPTTPVSFSVTDIFLSSTFGEQSSTSSSNTDTSSSEFLTSANSSILGTQSLPVETSSVAMTSPGDVTVAGTISPDQSTASPPTSEPISPEHYETSPESSYSESPTPLTTSGQQNDNITTTTIEAGASLTSASNGYYVTSSSLVSAVSGTTNTFSLTIENLSTATGIASLETLSASEIITSTTRVSDISLSSQPHSLHLSVVESTAWPTVEAFSPSSSKATQISSPSTAAIEFTATSTENSEISTLSSEMGEVTASFIRPITASVHSTDKSEISMPSTKGLEISSTEAIAISSSSTAEPYKILYSSVEPSTAQSSVENVLASTSKVNKIATPTAEVNGASASAEPYSSYFSVKESTTQSSVQSYPVSVAKVSDVSTSSTGNSAIPTPSTGVIEVSMFSTKDFEISTLSTESNDISKSSIAPYKLSASADISSLHLSVGESITHSSVENLSMFSAKQSDINTPSTRTIEVSVPSTKNIEISPSFTKSLDISTSFTVANEISVSAEPYSQHFPVQVSDALSSVETFSVSSATASVYPTHMNEILVSSSLHSSSGESISESLEENLSGSFTKASEIATPFTGVIEVSVPSTIESSITLTEIKISAPSVESNDISTSFTVDNEVSASVEPYTLHPFVKETTVHPLVENLSVSFAKASETAMTFTEAFEVSASFSTGGSETSTPSTAGTNISTPFIQTNDMIVTSSLYSSAGESISRSLEENLSVFSVKASDITTPSTGAIEVSKPSTKEIEISTPSTGRMEISAPSTESNDISMSFTVPTEVSASAEPYRQHLSVEASTAPSSVETFSVSSAVTSKMTTPYSGAIDISSPLSIVERETSPSFIWQTDILVSFIQAVKVSASAESYSLHPSGKESISQSVKESFTVSSTKASDITTPPTKAIEVSAPFSTDGRWISTPSTLEVDIPTSFTQTKAIFALSSSHPGESIVQSAVENLSVSSAQGSDITTPSTGGIEVPVPSTESNDISTTFNEVLVSAGPYRQQLSVEQSPAPSGIETFSMSSAITSEIATAYGGANGTPAPFTAAQIVVSTSFTGQIEILASSTQTSEILVSKQPYSLHPSVVGESLAHPLGENLSGSSAKASETPMPFTEVIEVSTFFSIRGSELSTPSTGDIDLPASSQANDMLASSSDVNKMSASSESYYKPSTAQSSVENLSVSSSEESKIPTPTSTANGVSASAEPSSLYLSVEQSTAQSSVKNYFSSVAKINEISTLSTGSIQVLSPSTGVVGLSMLFTKESQISILSTEEINIPVPSTVTNAISTSFTLVNEFFSSAEPSSKYFFVKECSETSSMGNFSVIFPLASENSTISTRSSADSTLFHESVDVSWLFSPVHSMMSTLSTLIDISAPSTEPHSIQYFSRESTKQSSIEILSSAEASKITTHYTEMNKIPASSAGPSEILTSWMTTGNEISTPAEPHSPHPFVGESTEQSNVSSEAQTTADVSSIQKEWEGSSVSPERQTITDLYSEPFETYTTNEKQTAMEAFSVPADNQMTTQTVKGSWSPAVTLSYYDSSDSDDTRSTMSSAAPEDSSIGDAVMSTPVAPYGFSTSASEEQWGSSEPPATSENSLQQQVSSFGDISAVSEASSSIPSFSIPTTRDFVTSSDISGSPDDVSVRVLTSTWSSFGVSQKSTAGKETSPVFYTHSGRIESVAETSAQLTTSLVSKELRFTHQASDNIQSVTSPEKTNEPNSAQLSGLQTTEPPDTSRSQSEAGLTTDQATDLATLLKMSAARFDHTTRDLLSTEPPVTKPSFLQTDTSVGQSSLLSFETSAVENVTSRGSWLSSAPEANFNTFSAPQTAETAKAKSLTSHATLPPTFGASVSLSDVGGTSQQTSDVTLNRSFSNGLWIFSTIPNSGSERVTERQMSQSDQEWTGSWTSQGDQQQTGLSVPNGALNLTSESAEPPRMTITTNEPSQGEIPITKQVSSSNEPFETTEYTATIRDSSQASKHFSWGSNSSGADGLFLSVTRSSDEDSTFGVGASELYSSPTSTDLETSSRELPVTLASVITTSTSDRLLDNGTVTASDETTNGTATSTDTVTQNDTGLTMNTTTM